MYAPQPDPISLTVVLVELSFEKTFAAHGTGVVIQTRHGPVLVTAAHNLTGRHPDGKCVSDCAILPNLLSLRNHYGTLVQSLPLYAGDNDPNTDSPRYLRHRVPVVDVALLPLPKEAAKHAVSLLHQSLWRPESLAEGIFQLSVADTCHIVGYPERLMNETGNGRVLPLWKTGHLANDPNFNFTNLKLDPPMENAPVCLIDATTRPGQSGAPVFVVNENGPKWNFAAARGLEIRPPDSLAYGRRTRLVGIYTGRTSDSSDVGLVWRPSVIHEILTEMFGNGW